MLRDHAELVERQLRHGAAESLQLPSLQRRPDISAAEHAIGVDPGQPNQSAAPRVRDASQEHSGQGYGRGELQSAYV